MPMRWFWIGLAGFLGAIARYKLDGWISDRSAGDFPWGTLAVNLSGAFVLALLFTFFTERASIHPDLRFAATTGFLGAYTTLSTFALETHRLMEGNAVGLAFANVAATLVGALVAVWLGTAIARV